MPTGEWPDDGADLRFESTEEEQQYLELAEEIRAHRRGSEARRWAIEELRRLRKRIEDRERFERL